MANPYPTIETQYKVEFSQQVHVLAQEKMSKLSRFVKNIDFQGEAFGYDRFGAVSAQEVTERFQPIVLQGAAWDRRWIVPRWFTVPVGIDKKDIEKMARNPSPELAEACVSALMREKDVIIYQAATATVNTGKSFASTSPVTFAQDGGVTIDATGGFGFSTLQTIKSNFVDAAVAVDAQVDIALTIDGKREQALLGELELTSTDYATDKPVAAGTMGRAYGIELVPFASNPQIYQPLLVASGGTRTLLALAENSIALAKGIVDIRFEERTDMAGKPIQIVADLIVGAVRTEGSRVQAVTVVA